MTPIFDALAAERGIARAADVAPLGQVHPRHALVLAGER